MARDERNLKWDNLDQIKFDASAQLRSQSTLTAGQARLGETGQQKFKTC